MDFLNAFLAEMKSECAITRRVLERVPDGKLAWQPHAKSMTLGKLAWHLAMLPLRAAGMAQQAEANVMAAASIPIPTMPETVAGMLAAFDEGATRGHDLLAGLSAEALERPFRMHANEKTIFEGKKKLFLRTVLLNHSIHHRGQLSVYLRLLDIPLPSIYGPSADAPLA